MSLRTSIWAALAVGVLVCTGQQASAQLSQPVRSDYATSELFVYITPGRSAADLARDFGLVPMGHLADAPNIVHFQAASVDAAFAARVRLAADERVQQAFVHYNNPLVPTFTPNDPFFFPGQDPGVSGVSSSTSDPRYPGQWHLINNMPGGTIDVNIKGAWDRGLTGNGVVIGILDTAVQVSHPDLAPNNRDDLSYDFFGNDSNPDPTGSEKGPGHGTSVAGVAAARGGNGIGVTGAAPMAGLAGFRTNLDWSALHDAYTHRNDAIKIKNHSYAFENPFANATFQESLLADSAARGVIHVFAAGNSRGAANEDANKSDLQNSPHVITVAALGSDGRHASYSSFGANVFVTAPSSGVLGITTTDLVGSAGSNFRKRVNRTVAMSAAPIGRPGWPDFACSTASIASARIALAIRSCWA